jgi:hypothetical protein
MLLERVGLNERGARLLVLLLIEVGDALLETLAGCGGRRRVSSARAGDDRESATKNRPPRSGSRNLGGKITDFTVGDRTGVPLAPKARPGGQRRQNGLSRTMVDLAAAFEPAPAGFAAGLAAAGAAFAVGRDFGGTGTLAAGPGALAAAVCLGAGSGAFGPPQAG